MKRRLRLLAGIAISVVCLYLVFRSIDWHTLWTVYREADYLYVVPAILILAFTSVARAFRWHTLMYPEQTVSIRKLFNFVNIGYLFNGILPAKIGELVRGYLVGRHVSGGIAQGLSTLLVERLMDVLAVVVLLVLLIPFVALPAWITRGGLIFGVVAIVGVGGLVVLARFGDRGLEWVWRYLGRLPVVGHPKVKTTLSNILVGLRVLSVPRLVPGILGWTVAVWVGYALFNYVLLFAFGLGELSFTAAAFVLCATGFGMMVPSSPGAIGVFEGAAVLALGVYGIDSSRAFGYAFGLHMLTNLQLIVMGLLGLLDEGLSFSDVRHRVGEPSAPVESENRPS